MSLKVTVKSTETRPRYKKNSTEVFAHEQTAWLWLVDQMGKAQDFPEKITLTIWMRDGKLEHPPFAVGDYTLHDSSFKVGDYGAIQVTPRLVPVAAQSAARAA